MKQKDRERLTLDYLHGSTYAAVADAFGIHPSRAHQIVVAELTSARVDTLRGGTIANNREHYAREYGLKIQHRAARQREVSYDSATPYAFYHEVESERRRDAGPWEI